MVGEFEKILGFHCAPVLMGVKASNLVCFSKKQFTGIHQFIEKYNNLFQTAQIVLESLWETDNRLMVLVYQKKALSMILKDKEVMAFLKNYGYLPTMTMEKCIECLKKNGHCQGGFPHEIGLFLGYPLEDVEGFIKNNGKNCQACGYWKVYADAERKLKLFKQYSNCRHRLCRALSKGFSIQQLVAV